MDTTFEVPDFRLPFTARKHPLGERANAEATAWAVGWGLIDDAAADGFAGIGFGHLAARIGPEASYSHVLVLAQWMAWSFVLDDQHDHLIRSNRLDAWTPFNEAIARYLDGGRRSYRNPMMTAFEELADQIQDAMPESQRARYRTHVLHMMNSLDQEAANRTGTRPPTIADYIATRRHSSQLPAMMDMSECHLGVEVPEGVYTHPAFQALLWSSIDVISWGNDVFSLPKEAACGDNNNIVVLLAQETGLPLRTVVRVVRELIAARVADFQEARQRLPHVADPSARHAMRKCADGYQDWMIGTDLWQRHDCTRYRDEDWAKGLEGAYNLPGLLVTARLAG